MLFLLAATHVVAFGVSSEEALAPVGPAEESQQQKKAVTRKRVHEADPEGRRTTRRATESHTQPMAATAAFWTATPVAVAPDAESTAAPSAAGPAIRERAGRATPVPGTTFDDSDVIKSNF